MITKKYNNWYAVIYYRDEFGKKKKRWVKADPNSQRAALKLEKRLITEMDQGKYNPSSTSQTVEQFAENYMDLAIKPHKTIGTINAYQYGINNFIKTLGHIKLDKLTSTQIQTWCNTEMNRVKPTTARDYYNVLNAMLKQAVKWRKISYNPCDGVTPPAYNKPNSNAYTQEQTAKIFDIMQDYDIYIFVLLGALCALRSGEMTGLCWDAVDLKNKKATICRQLIRCPLEKAKSLSPDSPIIPLWNTLKDHRAKTVLALAPTKTDASCNTIPLPDIVIDELIFLQKQRKLQMKTFGDSYIDCNLVASWADGTPFEQNYINKKFHKIITAHNIATGENLPVYRIHDLRHTAATLLLSKKVDIKVVSRGLRHANATFTRNKYQHVLDDMMSEQAEVMNKMFESTKKEHTEIISIAK